jgi:hypothetical protein
MGQEVRTCYVSPDPVGKLACGLLYNLAEWQDFSKGLTCIVTTIMAHLKHGQVAGMQACPSQASIWIDQLCSMQ